MDFLQVLAGFSGGHLRSSLVLISMILTVSNLTKLEKWTAILGLLVLKEDAVHLSHRNSESENRDGTACLSGSHLNF